MKNVFKFVILVVLFVPCVLFANYSYNYGDKVANTMEFWQITETTETDSTYLYGTPSVAPGTDTLEFNCLNFWAYASNGSSDVTDGKLKTTIWAKNNFKCYIDKIKFEEFGDTSLGGTGNTSTYTSVVNVMCVTVREIDRITIDPFTVTVNMSFTPKSSWNLQTDGHITALAWSGVVEVDVTQALRNHGYSTGFATLVDVALDNVLNAVSQTNTSASIAKKETNGCRVTPITPTIPEPSIICLLGLGSMVLLKRGH